MVKALKSFLNFTSYFLQEYFLVNMKADNIKTKEPHISTISLHETNVKVVKLLFGHILTMRNCHNSTCQQTTVMVN